MLAVRMKLLVSLPVLGSLHHEAFLVVADGGADHLVGDLQKFLLERAHQHDRPFDQARDLVEQRLILDQFEPLREGEVLGVGEDDVLAARCGSSTTLAACSLALVILEAAHGDRAPAP